MATNPNVIGVTLPEGVPAQVEAIARAEGLAVSAWVRRVVVIKVNEMAAEADAVAAFRQKARAAS